jgi:hypothetical protein
MCSLLDGKNFRHFWRTVNRHNGSSQISATIDGACSVPEILSVWRTKYASLYGSDRQASAPADPVDSTGFEECLFTADVVSVAIRSLRLAASGGLDGLCPGHFLHAPGVVLESIAFLFNCMIQQNVVPSRFSDTCVCPVLKKQTLDSTLSKNYRPVALCTVISKIFERAILNRFGGFLSTVDNCYPFEFPALAHVSVTRLSFPP